MTLTEITHLISIILVPGAIETKADGKFTRKGFTLALSMPPSPTETTEVMYPWGQVIINRVNLTNQVSRHTDIRCLKIAFDCHKNVNDIYLEAAKDDANTAKTQHNCQQYNFKGVVVQKSCPHPHQSQTVVR